MILAAKERGKRFNVIVVDSRPLFEGRETLSILSSAGISCTYIHISTIGTVIHQVSRIFLGAHSIFSNGTVMSRTGTSIIGMMGYEYSIPVIICCETYKFSNRVQLDSIVFNEIGRS